MLHKDVHDHSKLLKEDKNPKLREDVRRTKYGNTANEQPVFESRMCRESIGQKEEIKKKEVHSYIENQRQS